MLNEKEIWKPLVYGEKDLSERVEVSNLGRLRNIRTKKDYKLTPNHSGYLGTTISFGRKHKVLVKAHRAVAYMFLDNPDNKEQVNHIDGNKLNNNVSNLEWVTCQENLIHAISKGLKTSGENCKWSKLSSTDVQEIRYYFNKKLYSRKELANLYNVSYSTIQGVLHYRTYKNVLDHMECL